MLPMGAGGISAPSSDVPLLDCVTKSHRLSDPYPKLVPYRALTGELRPSGDGDLRAMGELERMVGDLALGDGSPKAVG